MTMTPDWTGYANLVGIVAVAGFLWNLHRDVVRLSDRVAALAERVARIEGAMDILGKFLMDREMAK